MKMGDGKGFLERLGKWFRTAALPARVGVIACSAVVVCGIAGGIIIGVDSLNRTDSGELESDIMTGASMESSEPISSEPLSSEEISSEAEVSQPESSEENSEPVGSQQTSSKTEQPVSSEAPVSSDPAVSSEPASSEPIQAVALPEGYQESFADAYQKNPEIIGQLVLPGTGLNNYVTQRPSDSTNSFYLDHDCYGNYYVWGTPYADFRASVNPAARTDNVTIYGHSNDSKGLMLSPIKQYKNLDFYKNNPTIIFNTVYQNETYKVISLFAENVDQPTSFAYHDFVNAGSEEDFNAFVSEAMGRSYISMPVDVQYGDKLITLSTCVTTSTQHSRYVMVARKVRDGESASVDVSQAAVNANQIPPSGPLN